MEDVSCIIVDMQHRFLITVLTKFPKKGLISPKSISQKIFNISFALNVDTEPSVTTYYELTSPWGVLMNPQGDVQTPQGDVKNSLFRYFSKTNFSTTLPGECETSSHIYMEYIYSRMEISSI